MEYFTKTSIVFKTKGEREPQSPAVSVLSILYSGVSGDAKSNSGYLNGSWLFTGQRQKGGATHPMMKTTILNSELSTIHSEVEKFCVKFF